MKKPELIVFLIVAFLAMLSACIEPFTPDIGEGKQYVVIQGSVSNEEGYQYAEVSRASTFMDREHVPVNDCDLRILDSEGNVFQMQNYYDGKYRIWIDKEYLQTGNIYKLEVTLPNGKRYESEYDTLLPCPGIDSIYYEYITITPDDPGRNPIEGLQFYIDYDATGDFAKNYRWEFTETWEYHPKELIWAYYLGIDTICPPEPFEEYGEDIRPIGPGCYARLRLMLIDKERSPPIDSLYTCWQTRKIDEVYTYTLHQKADMKVLGLPLNRVTNKGNRLSIRYSLLVRQLALSDAAFKYWNQLQQQAGETGGLYETQPYQLKGNIRCIDNEEEDVIGIFSASSATTKRFIGKFQFVDYHETCAEIISEMDALYSFLWRDNGAEPPIPLYFLTIDDRTDTFVYVDQSCFDCRLLGGTLTKPEYW